MIFAKLLAARGQTRQFTIERRLPSGWIAREESADGVRTYLIRRGRRYMFLEGGGWHVTNKPNTGVATSKSPPPEPCELDPTVPCATAAQQTAHADAPTSELRGC